MLNFSCLNPPVIHIILVIEKYFYFFDWKRLVEEIALTINTAHIQQIVDLVFRLNSLCNHAKSHNICHSGNSLKNSHSLVHGILIHFQKLHVNLQNVYIYILQHIQRRISASKIIHQNSKACISQCLCHTGDHLIFFYISTFCNLQLYIFRRKPIFANQIFKMLYYINCINIHTGYIDRNRNYLVSAFYPVLQRLANLLPHLHVQFCDQSVTLHNRNKISRCHNSLLRMLPAHQRFQSDDLTCVQITFRLKIVDKLISFQTGLHFSKEHMIILQACLHI